MLEILHKYFGYTEFRPLQEKIIKAILDKKNVFFLMPTVGEKSERISRSTSVTRRICGI